MFTCELDPRSRTPLCEQLYAALRAQIERGDLDDGARMPSKRQLSAHLGVSTATVESAYARLLSEGYCESRPRSGMYVSPDRPRRADAPRGEETPVRWDFSTGAADAENFPYATWARLMREVLGERDTSLLLSGDAQGSYAVRRALSGLLLRQRGVKASPEEIVLGAGTGALVSALVPVVGRERLFAVEDPGYPRVRRALVTGGARIAPVALSGGAVDVRALYASGAGAVYVTPARQFPTGEEMSAAHRASLLRWARETGGVILEDDCDGEFRFSGVSAPALFAADGGAQVVYMNTFARTLAPGLRLAYMALPGALAERYRATHGDCEVPAFEQETLRRFIEGGYLERHIAHMRAVYRARLTALCAAAKALSLGEVAPVNAGLHVLLRVGGKTPAHELAPLAARAGVRLTRLADYAVMDAGAADERTVLLGFAGMNEEAIEEGLRALRGAWFGTKGGDR